VPMKDLAEHRPQKRCHQGPPFPVSA
jgi:hypothetical protein